MTSNDYHFVTHWRVPGTAEEVATVLQDAADLVRWWPSVYLDVRMLREGDPSGVGNEVALYTKGWLPYTLRWEFTVTEVDFARTMTIVARGDFVGRGIWTFAQVGAEVDITYDWQIRADKPLLRDYSWLVKPIFAANHRWAMRQGERSLRLELQRRHAPTPAARAAVPAPPGPTSTLAQAAGLGLVGALAGALVVARGRVGAR